MINKTKILNFFHLIRIVLWAFLGVREKNEFQKDIKVNPIFLIITAVIMTFCFIGILMCVAFQAAQP